MPRRLSITVSLSSALSLFACASEVDAPRDAGTPAPHGATVVVLPDTQFYSCAYGEIFEAQTQWVVEQRESLGIAFALHTGDIVDSDVDAQWRVAVGSMGRMEGHIPFLVTTGNHDLSANRASLFARFFGTRGLDAFDLESEAFELGHADNAYAVVTIAGREWLVLGLEFGPRDRVVTWASEVLRSHADLPAILFTHAYLYSDGMRYDRHVDPRQRYHPDDYGQTPEQGVNDGQDLWTKLVERHENVRLVLSGHVIPDGTARSSVQRKSGSVVHQVLANYQTCDTCPCAEQEGGGGFLRLLEFTSAAIRVTTYSPYRDEWLRDDENEFSLPLP